MVQSLLLALNLQPSFLELYQRRESEIHIFLLLFLVNVYFSTFKVENENLKERKRKTKILSTMRKS